VGSQEREVVVRIGQLKDEREIHIDRMAEKIGGGRGE